RAALRIGQTDVRAASRHWQRVRELTRARAGDPEAAGLAMRGCSWLLSTGWRLGMTAEEVKDLAAEGLRWGEDSGDHEALLRLEGGVQSFHITGGDMAGALEHSLAAERIADASRDPRLRSSARYLLTYYWYNVG